MTEYTQQLNKNRLLVDDEFWQEDLIKIVKKNSSRFRTEKTLKKSQKMNMRKIREEAKSSQKVKEITHKHI